MLCHIAAVRLTAVVQIGGRKQGVRLRQGCKAGLESRGSRSVRAKPQNATAIGIRSRVEQDHLRNRFGFGRIARGARAAAAGIGVAADRDYFRADFQQRNVGPAHKPQFALRPALLPRIDVNANNAAREQNVQVRLGQEQVPLVAVIGVRRGALMGAKMKEEYSE